MRICRSLGVDPESGNVFWSDDNGRIARFNGEAIDIVATLPEMWRKVLWHAEERVFYGILWNSATLFRFDPRSMRVDSLGPMRMAPAPATLAFAFDPDQRTIHTLATGPGLTRRSQVQLASTVWHLSYDLESRRIRTRGPLRLGDGRWLTQSQSLLVRRDAMYALAWVEASGSSRDTYDSRRRGYAEEIIFVRAAF